MTTDKLEFLKRRSSLYWYLSVSTNSIKKRNPHPMGAVKVNWLYLEYAHLHAIV